MRNTEKKLLKNKKKDKAPVTKKEKNNTGNKNRQKELKELKQT